MQYFDKNGVEIKAGMTIRMEDGSLELVYDTTDSYGNPDLGLNASNEEQSATLRHTFTDVLDGSTLTGEVKLPPLGSLILKKA